jgi:RNA polymerase sigma-70 factor (ECF subfamily)
MTDDSAVASTFQGIRRELQRLVRRFVRPADIEDIVQETFLRAYEAERDRPIREPRAFMLQTARNLALNHLGRSEQKLVDSLEDVTDTQVLPKSDSLEADFETRERFHAFCRAVRELPLQCRRTFILKKVYGLSQKEISAYLGIAESTVEKHVTKGFLHCLNYLESRGLGAEVKRVAKPGTVRHG